ncbi:MAG TPA: ATP-binding protein, partial [Euzebyales bacterium]|nr:ATP-binding protein [Euzebyales bacterium]
MSPAVDDALLRVAQEALTNVGRHAGASQVDLTLSYLDDLVLLDVQDDGVGFDVSTADGDGDVTHGGYGLTSMRERLTLVGGVLVVESTPAEGTTVAARVPRAAATPPVAPEEPT